ncbi:MAG: SIS domain-containing protein [Comamonas sp.]|nr:SIS domain-containing protein [Comamonas sp.]
MLERIAASLPSLAPAEQRVAHLVLHDPSAFARLPVRTLAEQAQVSKPTVVRFCRSMGYDGLADFKLKLVGSVSEGVPFIHRSVDVDDKPADVLVKVVDNSVAAFLEYRNAAAPKALEAAAQAILQTWRQHQRVVFFGAGNSGIVADDAQHKFFRLGLTSMSCSDGHVQLMNAALLRRGDCAVIISNSGLTRDLIAAAELASQAGATTIAITASNSPLARACTIHLAADHPEGYDLYSPMVSRLLHLLIIDVLATCVALQIGPSVQQHSQVIKQLLRSKRYEQ